jgi:type IV pilus assembly protein PilW
MKFPVMDYGSLPAQQGLSLVEIMVAMIVGLMLTAGVLQVYGSSKQAYRLADNLSRMQENARFGMEILARDIRMAGFIPCRPTANVANTINGGTGLLTDFFSRAVAGYDGTSSDFAGSGLPNAGSTPGLRVAGADAIAVLRGSDHVFSVTAHNPNAANFKINATPNFNDGDVMLVCDADQSAIFQATNVSPTNVTVVHNEGTGTPGNCNKFLGGSGYVDCVNNPAFTAYTFGPGSQLVRFEGVAYYIGVSASGTTRSLYRRRLGVAAVTRTDELLEGIENMQIVYGLDTDQDGEAERYVAADSVATWNDVVSVRVGLLVHTPEQVAAGTDNTSYNVAGIVIDDSGTAVTHPADRRQRYVVTSTIDLRNRGPS